MSADTDPASGLRPALCADFPIYEAYRPGTGHKALALPVTALGGSEGAVAPPDRPPEVVVLD